jgi:hypothetical protein
VKPRFTQCRDCGTIVPAGRLGPVLCFDCARKPTVRRLTENATRKVWKWIEREGAQHARDPRAPQSHPAGDGSVRTWSHPRAAPR